MFLFNALFVPVLSFINHLLNFATLVYGFFCLVSAIIKDLSLILCKLKIEFTICTN